MPQRDGGASLTDALDASRVDHGPIPDVGVVLDMPTPLSVDVPGMDAPSNPVDSGVCAPGTMVCGASGCVDVRSSASHCGMCGRACVMGELCVAGVCRADCPPPNALCGGAGAMMCVNLQDDVRNCGACGNVCAVINATPTCTAGVCRIGTCGVPFGDCDNNAANGCEVNTSTSVMHCGRCGMGCPLVANGTPTCAMGSCGATCNNGFELLNGRCIVAGLFPRPVLPISLGDTTLRRPTLRWQLPAGLDGAEVSLCRNRACGVVIETFRAMGNSGRPTLPLPARTVVFWRLRGTVGGATAMSYSPTWLFHVPAVDATSGVDTSTNPHLDLNGDGLDDLAVGAPQASPGMRAGAGTVSVYHGSVGGIPVAPTRVLEGLLAGDEFGVSVASAGDVNGDGFGELIVGASNADPGARSGAGTASLFYGSAVGIAMVASRVVEGSVAADRFGEPVATAGDVNADGFADVLIGASNADPGGRLSAGSVSVFHGSAAGISMLATRVLDGALSGDSFGQSLSSAGDINGDGFSDVVFGAPLADPGGRSNAGTASVFHGGVAGLTMVAARVLDGVAGSDQFAFALGAQDVNNDGFSDLIVGAPAADANGRASSGSASVFHGSAMGLANLPARVLSGGVASDLLGISCAGAGDVNGDGFGDIVVGVRGFDVGMLLNAGAAFVFHGTAAGIPAGSAAVLNGVAASDSFGSAVAGAGDLNGDGFADVVVGTRLADPGGRLNAGTASVFHGGAMGVSLVVARLLEGGVAGDQFGSSVARVWNLSDESSRRRLWRAVILTPRVLGNTWAPQRVATAQSASPI